MKYQTVYLNCIPLNNNNNMSVRKETYLIYGFKFGESFTDEYFDNEDLYSQFEYNRRNGDDGKILFLSDGMNGMYTFFGYILSLSDGGDWYEDMIKKIPFIPSELNSEIFAKFQEHYPEVPVSMDDIKLYYVPHYV